MRVHEEFKESMQEAEFAALAWWEDVGQAGLTIPNFNAAPTLKRVWPRHDLLARRIESRSRGLR